MNNKDNLFELFEMGCAIITSSFNSEELSTKDFILRNFIAKSISQLRSIIDLNKTGKTLDCYILYRAMVDRLAHVFYLGRTNSFEDFDNWSFMKQFEANSKALSDEKFKEIIPKEAFTPSKENKERYKLLKTKNIKWIRPDIEKEFKQLDLSFLYKFGYDYASSHVHPMASDGWVEYNLMLSSPSKKVISHLNIQSEIIINNSVLISSLTVNECLNASSFKWMKVVFNFIDSFGKALANENNEFELNYYRLKSLIDQNERLKQ